MNEPSFDVQIEVISKIRKKGGNTHMGRNLTKEELILHKDMALQRLDTYMTSLIENSDPKIKSKSDKLSYWIEDWTTFLDFESEFSPKSLRRYKRGEIIKAHLGYNIGSEEGGLHYCVVIDKENSKNSPIITVIPLTSIKRKTDLEHLHKGNIYLGNEIFTNLNSKVLLVEKKCSDRIALVLKALNSTNKDIPKETLLFLQHELDTARKEEKLIERIRKEIQKMKIGSIALVPQIRTISKIRIYDPKTNFDILSNVKLSNEKLDLIDREILHNFTGVKNV